MDSIGLESENFAPRSTYIHAIPAAITTGLILIALTHFVSLLCQEEHTTPPTEKSMPDQAEESKPTLRKIRRKVRSDKSKVKAVPLETEVLSTSQKPEVGSELALAESGVVYPTEAQSAILPPSGPPTCEMDASNLPNPAQSESSGPVVELPEIRPEQTLPKPESFVRLRNFQGTHSSYKYILTHAIPPSELQTMTNKLSKTIVIQSHRDATEEKLRRYTKFLLQFKKRRAKLTQAQRSGVFQNDYARFLMLPSTFNVRPGMIITLARVPCAHENVDATVCSCVCPSCAFNANRGHMYIQHVQDRKLRQTNAPAPPVNRPHTSPPWQAMQSSYQMLPNQHSYQAQYMLQQTQRWPAHGYSKIWAADDVRKGASGSNLVHH